MNRFRKLFHRGLWGPDADDAAVWEIEHHLQERADELEAEGMSREEAMAEARRAFGDVDRVRRRLRTMDRGRERSRRVRSWLGTVLQDIRYGVRGMGRRPGHSAALVATLALGIGATGALFTVMDPLFLRPLPYADAEELVDVGAALPDGSGVPYLSWDQATTWLPAADFLEEGMLTARRSVLYLGGEAPVMVEAMAVTANFEHVLGVAPVVGRELGPEDARPGAEPVALLTYGFWQRAFGGDAAAVGGSMDLNGIRHRIVGVLPDGFKYPAAGRLDLYVALHDDGTMLGKGVGRVHLLGRMRDGMDVEQAEARAVVLARGLEEATPREGGWSMRLFSLEESRARLLGLRDALRPVAGAVLLILLAALTNGVNLWLVSTSERERELATRLALGASRGRVFRQLATESLLLALAGGAAAAILAYGTVQAVQGFLPWGIRFAAAYAIVFGPRAMAVIFGLAFISGLVLSLPPALHAAAASLRGLEGLKSRGGARRLSAVRRSLVVVEVALSVTLLTGTVLLVESLVRLNRVAPGFQPEGLATMVLQLPTTRYPDGPARSAFLRRLEERLEAVPGVEGATIAGALPPGTGFAPGVKLQAEGSPPAVEQPFLVPQADVSSDFFDVVGAHLVAGRPFRDADLGRRDVAIIDEDMARFLWGDAQAAVGRRFRIDEDSGWRTVVGVMGDLKLRGPDDRTGDFELLYPYAPERARSYAALAIRSTEDAASFLLAVRTAVRDLDAELPIAKLGWASDDLAESVAMPRFLAFLFSILGGLGLTLAVVGIYALLSYGVRQRSRELGVRAALGATARRLRRMVVGEGMALATTGVVLGLGGAYAMSRIVGAVLYHVDPTGPFTWSSVALVVLGTAALASWVPGARATRVDPAAVLRAD